MGLRTIFFDAGNTLLFPDLGRTLAPLAAYSLRPTEAQLQAAECAAKEHRDRPESSSSKQVDQEYWQIYYTQLLERMGRNDPCLCAALVAATRVSANWSRVRPGSRDVLQRLRRRYRLGVISNSDGQVSASFRQVGLEDCFDSFTDSALVGYEKPHPGIFQAALHSLAARPEESLYVGDIYSVDYLGALGAGMHAILMDPAGAYRDAGLPRIESLQELERQLAAAGNLPGGSSP